MKRRLKAPSPALVIALIALFVALGGTSYAAIKLPKNSVGTKQIRNNAVTGAKIKNGAVTKSKINTSGLIVPNATHASTADSATSPTNATNATNATTAANAQELGGVAPSGYWPNADALPAGRTLRGSWTVQFTAPSAGAQLNVPVSFGFLLPTVLPITYVAQSTSNSNCPGTDKNPQALPGHVCVYESRTVNLSSIDTFETTNPFTANTADRFGFKLLGVATAAGFMTAEGSWAVTAPTS